MSQCCQTTTQGWTGCRPKLFVTGPVFCFTRFVLQSNQCERTCIRISCYLVLRIIRDTLAERLRRRPAKPMGSPRVGSNPTGVVLGSGTRSKCKRLRCVLYVKEYAMCNRALAFCLGNHPSPALRHVLCWTRILDEAVSQGPILSSRGKAAARTLVNVQMTCDPIHHIKLHSYSLVDHCSDTVSERLRRWTRNPLGSARRGSNPLGVVLLVLVAGGFAAGVLCK